MNTDQLQANQPLYLDVQRDMGADIPARGVHTNISFYNPLGKTSPARWLHKQLKKVSRRYHIAAKSEHSKVFFSGLFSYVEIESPHPKKTRTHSTGPKPHQLKTPNSS